MPSGARDADDRQCAPFQYRERNILRHVFNPHMSDWRDEGEALIPPPTSPTYQQKLKELVKAEQATLRQRTALFLSDEFQVDKRARCSLPRGRPPCSGSCRLTLVPNCLR